MPKNAVSTFYDEKYTDYHHPAPQTWLEKIYVRLKHLELHRNDAAINLLEPATSILDIGAGFGELLIKAHAHGFKKLSGIDISPVVTHHCQKKLAQQNLKANISCQNIDEGLDFTSQSFDAVTMVAVLEHVFSPHQALSEIHRVLKRGGQLVIEVPNVVFLPRRVAFLLGQVPKTSDEPLYKDGHLQFFSQSTLKQLLEEHQFRVVHQGCSGIGWKWRNRWPTLLGANIVIKAIKL